MGPLGFGLVATVLAFSPEGEARPLGVAPVSVEGKAPKDLADKAGARISERMSEFSPTQVELDPGCADAGCYQSAASQAGVGALIQVKMTAEARDYILDTRLIDGSTGEVLRSDENFCEICTYEEALEALDQQLSNLVGPVQTALTAPEAEPTAKLRIVSRPADAVVRVDGEVVGSTPYEGEVSAGPHEISLSKEGYAATTETLELAEGSDRALDLKLRKKRGNAKLFRTLGWAGVGASVPLLATGIALIVLDENPHKKSCTGDSVDVNGTCEFRYNTLAGGVVSLITGVALAGGGATLLILDKRENGKMEAWIGPGGGGLRGRF